MQAQAANRRSGRAGFTLIELSIVIVIILILVALLLPAINSTIRRSKETQQFNEISQLSLALESFKEKYGVYPPSRIRLRENTMYQLNSSHPDYELDSLSIQYLKRMFPNIVLQTENKASGAAGTTTPNPLFNWFNDGVNTTYELEGDECLVFFLGGIADTQSSPGTIILNGFSKDPANPSGLPDTNRPLSLSRELPLFTFDAGRLFIRQGGDVDDPAANQDFGITTARPKKLPSYRSFISPTGNNKPIAYFSSYEGRGYRPNDCNIPDKFQEEPTQLPGPIDYLIQVQWPTITTTPTQHAKNSRGPNPYLEFDPLYPADGSLMPNPVTSLSKAFKPESYQLITAGFDGVYGLGGVLRGSRFSTSDVDYDNISNVGDGRTVGSFSSGLK